MSEISEKTERFLSGALDPGEKVVARGRAEVARYKTSLPLGSTYDYLLVTNRRVLWASLWPEIVSQLSLEDVTAFADSEFQGHRYVLAVQHRPTTFLEWQPRWKVLWFEWGNMHAYRQRTETRFGFSRRDTEAALALRAAFEERNISRIPFDATVTQAPSQVHRSELRLARGRRLRKGT